MARRSLLLLLLLGTGVAAVLLGTALQRERTYERLVARGTEALQRGDPGSAIEALSGAIALKPDSMVAHLRRGEAYLRRGTGDARLALRDFREAARLDPAAVRPLERLGDLYLSLGRYDRARDEYARGLALNDRSPGATYKLALVTYQAGDVDGARVLAERAVALDGRLPEAHYLHGLCLLGGHVPEQAVDAFRRALALDPGLHGARAELAAAARRLGRPREEIAELDRLARETGRPEVHRALAEALVRLGHLDEAIEVLEQALARTPDDVALMTALGQTWLTAAEAHGESRARAEASRWLQQAQAAERRSEAPTSRTLAALGRARLLDGDPQAAVLLLQQAAALPPVSPGVLEDLALAAEQLDEWSLARATLERADALDLLPEPDRRAARTARLGELSRRLADHTSAARWFAQASQLRPDDPALVVRLVESQRAAGDDDEARNTLAAALSRWPQERALLALGN